MGALSGSLGAHNLMTSSIDNGLGALRKLGSLDRFSPPKKPAKLSDLVFRTLWELNFLDFALSANDFELQKLDALSLLASSSLTF